MEITLEKKEKSTANLKVNLKEADYLPKIASKLKEYGKKISIKGFRPGKVPASVVEKMYGKSVKIEEINQLLSSSVHNYIRENNLSILGDPLPEKSSIEKIDWENQKDFEFTYNLGLVPDFKCELSDKVKVSNYKIEVDAKSVNETLENLRNQYGKMTSPEVSEEGDILYGELKELNGDFSTPSMISLSKIKKGELKKFVGLKKDDKIEFDIKKAFEDTAALAQATGLSKEDAEKKDGKFELTVTNVSRSEAAALDQDFFDKIFGKDTVKTEEEFNKKLKETIEENYTREANFLLEKNIREKLVESTEIDLPNDFLKEWLLISNDGKITREQIDNEYDLYLKELKWSLIKNKIGDANNVKVENEEVLQKTKEMVLQQFGNMPLTDEFNDTLNKIADNYLKQENGRNYMRLFEQVLNDKVIEIVKGQIKIQDKKVSVEEFKKEAGF